ncbi:DUF2092 domain-containing protein [Falsiroseomonas sp. HW251]|uniref:DUF2092 domain-containing protein n=1 Tax=Falsiroseomonas sp. HW251 TaxID=3390998 RepID=UPI003D3214E6
MQWNPRVAVMAAPLLVGWLAGAAMAQQAPAQAQGTQAQGTQVQGTQVQGTQAQATPPAGRLGLRIEVEPRAIQLLQGMCAALTGARSLSFNAVATYESMARTGHPLAYATAFEVLMQRPDRLRVVMPGDGPASEFYYDGTRMIAFAPEANLVAVADAPPTIDAMLQKAYADAAIYFPFGDLLGADPCREMQEGLRVVFVVGQSRVVGGVTTDVLAFANDQLQGQIWIGAEDRLPRLFRATYFDDPQTYRHAIAFSDWRLNPPVPADAFASARAAQANPMSFARPDAPTRAPQR